MNKMKTKLINHPQYFLLVDLEAEIKEDDLNIWSYSNFHRTIFKVTKNHFNESVFPYNHLKIIAHIPKLNAYKLEGVYLLPELSSNKISFDEYLKQHPYKTTRSFTREDWVFSMWEKWNELPSDEEDVEQFFTEQLKENRSLIRTAKTIEDQERQIIVCDTISYLKLLYTSAKKSKKKYNELVEFVKQVRDDSELVDESWQIRAEQLIESLNTPEEPIDFEVEMIWYKDSVMGYAGGAGSIDLQRPKVINGVLQGKYKF